MENTDIRWKQRFQNYEKALNILEKAILLPNPDIFQKAGLIQFFETSYELAWNLLKDYLEAQGFTDVKSPRNVLKKAFETSLIQNGHHWMDLLVDRNLTSHTYDEQKVQEIEKLIRTKYFPLLKNLYNSFNQRENDQ